MAGRLLWRARLWLAWRIWGLGRLLGLWIWLWIRLVAGMESFLVLAAVWV